MGKPAISFATGEQIKTGSNSNAYRSGWDAVFNKTNKTEEPKPKNPKDKKDERTSLYRSMY